MFRGLTLSAFAFLLVLSACGKNDETAAVPQSAPVQAAPTPVATPAPNPPPPTPTQNKNNYNCKTYGYYWNGSCYVYGLNPKCKTNGYSSNSGSMPIYDPTENYPNLTSGGSYGDDDGDDYDW